MHPLPETMTGLRDPRRSGVVDPAFARDPAGDAAVTVSPSLQSIRWIEAGQAGRSEAAAEAPTAAAVRTPSQQHSHHTEHSSRHGQSSQCHLSSLAIAAPRIMKAGLWLKRTTKAHSHNTHCCFNAGMRNEELATRASAHVLETHENAYMMSKH